MLWTIFVVLLVLWALEPPPRGGNACGRIQTPLEFLGGNASPRLWRGRGQFGSKSNLVEGTGIEPVTC